MDHVNEGDGFLVGRGFPIQDILLRKQATVFILPFLNGGVALTKEEVLLTKRGVKARIHVERFSERFKTFRLLDGLIPQNLAPLASQLVLVASYLVNFHDYLCN